MAAILESVVVPASLVLVIGLGYWSYRTRGAVLALEKNARAYPAVAIVLVVATLAQLAVPMACKDASQPLLSVLFVWALGALVIAGLAHRRGEAPRSESPA